MNKRYSLILIVVFALTCTISIWWYFDHQQNAVQKKLNNSEEKVFVDPSSVKPPSYTGSTYFQNPNNPKVVIKSQAWQLLSGTPKSLENLTASYWAYLQSDSPEAPMLALKARDNCVSAMMGETVSAEKHPEAAKASLELKRRCSGWTKTEYINANETNKNQLFLEGAKRGDMAAQLALTSFNPNITPSEVVNLTAQTIKAQHPAFFEALSQALSNPSLKDKLKVVGYPLGKFYPHIVFASLVVSCEFGEDCSQNSTLWLVYCSGYPKNCTNSFSEMIQRGSPEADKFAYNDILQRLRSAVLTNTNPLSIVQ